MPFSQSVPQPRPSDKSVPNIVLSITQGQMRQEGDPSKLAIACGQEAQHQSNSWQSTEAVLMKTEEHLRGEAA